jgi:hypothetical protein
MHPSRAQCKYLHAIWFRYRREMEVAMGMDLPANTTETWKYWITFGYCRKTGEFRNTYLMMNTTHAERPLSPFPTLPPSKMNIIWGFE